MSRQKFYAIEPLLIGDMESIAPGESFEMENSEGLNLVAGGHCETEAMHEARAEARAAVEQAREDLEKAQRDAREAVRKLAEAEANPDPDPKPKPKPEPEPKSKGKGKGKGKG